MADKKQENAKAKLFARLTVSEKEEKSGKFMPADKVQTQIRKIISNS